MNTNCFTIKTADAIFLLSFNIILSLGLYAINAKIIENYKEMHVNQCQIDFISLHIVLFVNLIVSYLIIKNN